MGDGANTVPCGPSGLFVAIQSWAGDSAESFRLARLIADIEPRPRDDVTILFMGRAPENPEGWTRTARDCASYVSRKFPVMVALTKREGRGHPDGSNALAGGVLDHLASMWPNGLNRASVFLAEADGCPLSADWLDRLLAEHRATLAAGKSITGPYMDRPAHINGTMIVSVPWWIDHPSVHRTPSGEGWDVYHGETYLRDANRTKLILNLWGSCNWTRDQLVSLSAEYAWMTSQKDDSVIAWAERALASRDGKRTSWREMRDR